MTEKKSDCEVCSDEEMQVKTATGSNQQNRQIQGHEMCDERNQIMTNTPKLCNPLAKANIANNLPQELKQFKLKPIVDHLQEIMAGNRESGSGLERTVKSPDTMNTV